MQVASSSLSPGRACPLYVRSAVATPLEGETELEAKQRCHRVLREPPLLSRLHLHGARHPDVASRQCLRNVVTELHWRCLELSCLGAEALEEPWAWAQRELSAGSFPDFSQEELVALRLCSSEQVNVLSSMGGALLELEDLALAASTIGTSSSSRTGTTSKTRNQTLGVSGVAPSEVRELGRLWKTLGKELIKGIDRLRQKQERPNKLYCALRVSRQTWDAHFSGRNGNAVCFFSPLRASERAPKVGTGSPRSAGNAATEDTIDCVLELDGTIANEAANIEAMMSGAEDTEAVWLLPPYVRGYVRSLEVQRYAGQFASDIQRVRIEGVRTVQPLSDVLEAPDESVLAGALLVGLHASMPPATSGGGDDAAGGVPAETTRPALLAEVAGCFRAMAAAAEVRNPEVVKAMWKGYWECLFQDVQSWKQLKELTETKTGVIGVARAAVLDVAVAARNVTMRSWGCESCMNHDAMEEERLRRAERSEDLRRDAVGVARDQVAALQLETLTDPEGFLRFLQHDPIAAFQAVPAALEAYIEAGPAQRVLLFAKLMGLAAMAGGLLRGDPKVSAAFNSPFPLQQEACLVDSDEEPEVKKVGASHVFSSPEDAARQAVGLLAQQRLRLARTRLLIAGGAPDVGKTTILREAFGFEHFVTGLSRSGQTDEITFALHPDGDEHLRPVYAVDTPGFGDGEQMHRNDMLRLLLGAGSWLPGGVTLLWVVKAGRNVRQAADDLLRKMSEYENVKTLVVVTHVDKFFEERYREVGPQWKDGILRGVSPKDVRWPEQRKKFMCELKREVEVGVASVVGGEVEAQSRGLVYACLGGWMTGSEVDEDDEFAQPPPWPWARQELTDCFNILARRELRTWLDKRFGL